MSKENVEIVREAMEAYMGKDEATVRKIGRP